jgi:hypothetical protein
MKHQSETEVLKRIVGQCFWISIFEYLQKGTRKYTSSFLALIDFSGLKREFLDKKFDFFNDTFNKAVEKIAKDYELKIIIYTVNSSGVIIRVARTYGIGDKYIVNIAMFGQNHFELISEEKGEIFVPAVNYKNELKKINNISVSEDIKKKILDLIDKITFLNIYKNELKDISANMTKNKETIENLFKNIDLLKKYEYQ